MDTGASHLTEISGAFFGNALDFPTLDALMLKHYARTALMREPEMTAKTWFDYRHAHPVIRAYFFQNEFTRAWRRAHRRFYDFRADVARRSPWPKRNLFGHRPQMIRRTIASMHVADQLCIPYDIYLDAGFEHLMQKAQFKTWAQSFGDAKLPPVWLFGGGEVAIAAQERFDRLNLKRVHFAHHPEYAVANYRGAPWQREHQAYLCREAKRHGADCARVVAGLVSQRKVLTEIETARHLGIEMVRQARRFYA